MNMHEYNKMMLNRLEQTYLEPDDSPRHEVCALCAVCNCEELGSEMYRDDTHGEYVCHDCIDKYCNVDNALRFLAANNLERDYFVRVYMNTDCNDSADDRIVDACKDAWLKKYFMRARGEYSFEADTLLGYVSENEFWNDWVASELLS